jgi:hypothetical protein
MRCDRSTPAATHAGQHVGAGLDAEPLSAKRFRTAQAQMGADPVPPQVGVPHLWKIRRHLRRESRLLANPATAGSRKPPLRRSVVGTVPTSGRARRRGFAPASFDLEAVLCDRRAPVRICESCDAVCIEDAWYHADLITFAWRVDPHVSHSHTICPECTARTVLGTPYPG